MKPTNTDAGEIWRNIPGFAGIYQASTLGRIRKIHPRSGRITVLQSYTKSRKGSTKPRAPKVHINLPDGRRVERSVLGLVAQTFLRAGEGMRPVHRNGCRGDNALDNIVMMTDSDMGKNFAGNSRRRPVVKINRNGDVLDCYPSASAAGKENYMHRQTVADRCNRKRKNEFELSGFSFRWDD